MFLGPADKLFFNEANCTKAKSSFCVLVSANFLCLKRERKKMQDAAKAMQTEDFWQKSVALGKVWVFFKIKLL